MATVSKTHQSAKHKRQLLCKGRHSVKLELLYWTTNYFMEFFSQLESYTDAVLQLEVGHWLINNGCYKENHPKIIC